MLQRDLHSRTQLVDFQFSKFHTSFPKKRKSQESCSKHPPLKKLQLDSDTVLKRTRNDWGRGLLKAAGSLPSLPGMGFSTTFRKVPYNKGSTTTSLPRKKNHPTPSVYATNNSTGFSSFSSWICIFLMLGKKVPKIFSTWAVKGDRKLRCPTKRGFGSSRSISGRSSPVAFRET